MTKKEEIYEWLDRWGAPYSPFDDLTVEKIDVEKEKLAQEFNEDDFDLIFEVFTETFYDEDLSITGNYFFYLYFSENWTKLSTRILDLLYTDKKEYALSIIAEYIIQHHINVLETVIERITFFSLSQKAKEDYIYILYSVGYDNNNSTMLLMKFIKKNDDTKEVQNKINRLMPSLLQKKTD